MQHLAYHAHTRWANIETIREGVSKIPDPDPRMAAMAAQLFGALPDTFDFSTVTDEYGERLEVAVAAKAAGTPIVTGAAPVAEAPGQDLMALLAASLASAS